MKPLTAQPLQTLRPAQGKVIEASAFVSRDIQDTYNYQDLSL